MDDLELTGADEVTRGSSGANNSQAAVEKLDAELQEQNKQLWRLPASVANEHVVPYTEDKAGGELLTLRQRLESPDATSARFGPDF